MHKKSHVDELVAQTMTADPSCSWHAIDHIHIIWEIWHLEEVWPKQVQHGWQGVGPVVHCWFWHSSDIASWHSLSEKDAVSHIPYIPMFVPYHYWHVRVHVCAA